jgi:1-deoxy-D-xylulose-5-phosphate reductoisomerase
VRRILVLGSTGSIGVQALEVIDDSPDLVACGLACGTRLAEMQRQATSRAIAHTACAAGGGSIPASADLAELIDAAEPDLVLNGLVGSAGLQPTLAALERGIPVALANKESLVAGGEIVARIQASTGAAVIPVDSEHSAVFQLIATVPAGRIDAIVLTASGGPFRGRTRDELNHVTAADALAHPTWTMGAKITIDSATLMNKGLEVIEAHHLFGVGYDAIEVVVHPQSAVHGMIRLDDGSVIAHMGPPDMRVPIGFGLMWPDAPPTRGRMPLAGRTLEFLEPDDDTFRCLRLARDAGRAGGTAPAVLNAANEVAVAAFLAGAIEFLDIAAVVAGALDEVPSGPGDDLEAVLEADRSARSVATRALAVAR